MIHPDTHVRTVSDIIGNGVFATALIRKGTIVVVQDCFDTVLTQDQFQQLPAIVKDAMETYLYHDRAGRLVLSWDHARFMNHSCYANTMMTAYNLEIAVRDIQPGEELTTEYGLLNIQEPYQIHCKCSGCREHLRIDDIDQYSERWDLLIKESLQLIPERDQPLMALLDGDAKERIFQFHKDPTSYTSVKELKWQKPVTYP